MAKVKNSVLFEGISGTLGKTLVFRQMADGRTIVSTRPDFSKRIFSEQQLAHQSRFQEAAAYACQAAKNQPIYAQLAKGTSKTAYNLALSDWFNPPVIHRVKLQNESILIDVTDTALVSKVTVTILDSENKTLEQGEAVLGESSLWEYKPTQKGRVIVEAFDLCGNHTIQEGSSSE